MDSSARLRTCPAEAIDLGLAAVGWGLPGRPAGARIRSGAAAAAAPQRPVPVQRQPLTAATSLASPSPPSSSPAAAAAAGLRTARPATGAAAQPAAVPKLTESVALWTSLRASGVRLRRFAMTRATAAETSSGSPFNGSDPASGAGDGDGVDSTAPPPAPKRRSRKGAVAAAATASQGGEAADGGGGSGAKGRRSRVRKTPPDGGAPGASAAATPTTSPSPPSSYDSEDDVASATTTATVGAAATRRSVRRYGGGRAAAATPAHQQRQARSGADSAAGVDTGAGAGSTDAAAEAGRRAVRFSSKLPRGSVWTGVRRWVVFSDLHVRETSLGTCLEVLRAVAAEAERRQAGVMFLGDFWDRRGALPVEPLNQVLQEMSSWRCPVLMLVGNHDQVDLGGLRHGLTPLELACPHVHVFEEPTLWNGALWLPYRRESWVLEQAMAQAAAMGAAAKEGGGEADEGDGGNEAERQPLRAIFLHADVRTARTNQWRQAEEGLFPGAFPPGLPVYSGHYHLPHTVPGTAVTYVGSPYQVSMSEASESKRLLVLSAPSWQLEEEIPITIGPRHMRLNGPGACEQLRKLAERAAATAEAAVGVTASDGEAGSSSDGGDPAAPVTSPTLRAGDRIKLWLNSAEAMDEHVVQAMAELERAGVSVEQVLQPEAKAARVTAAEGLTTDQLIDLYCSAGGDGGDGGSASGGGGRVGQGLSAAAAAAVRAAVAEARDAAGAGAAGGGGGDGPMGRCVELEFESVRLRGFGPFVEEQTYPLASRGVRVVSGRNCDEAGADSNGAGKTSLVAAPLWALTGDVLARTESGGGGRVPVDAMRNDGCGAAAVAVRGQLNGLAFEVEREVKRGKTSSLRLRVGAEDLTLQDVSGTAERIRRLFATDLLRCSAFFGQNDITGLLEANDAALKQKLGLVVDLEIWEAARQLLVAPRKAAAAAAAEAGGRVGLLGEQVARREQEVAQLAAQEAEWAAEQARRLDQLRVALAERSREAAAAAGELAPRAEAAQVLVSELRGAAAAAEAEQRRWEAELAAQQQAAARRAEALAAQASAPPPRLTQQQQQQPASDAATQERQRQQEEADAQVAAAAASGLLRERQREAAQLQLLLVERQAAAAQALGRLRQLEAGLREYTTAVATAAAAAASGGQPGAAAAATAAAVKGAAGDATVAAGRAAAAAALLQRAGSSGDGGHGRDGGGGSGSGPFRMMGLGGREAGRGDDDTGSSRGDNGGGGGEPVVVVAGPQHGPEGGSSGVLLAVCDRCRQPISAEQYGTNVERLQGDVRQAQQEYDTAAREEARASAAHASAARLVAEADAAVAELQRRRLEAERRAAAEARAAAAAAEREARAAEEAARAAREAAWREAEGALRGLQARMAASVRTRGDLLAAASDLGRVASELHQATATVIVAAGTTDATSGTAQSPALYRYGNLSGDGAGDGGGDDDGAPATVTATSQQAPEELLREAGAAAAAGRGAAAAALRAVGARREAATALEAAGRETRPWSELRARAQRELQALEAEVAQAEAAVSAAESHLSALTDADRALGRSGIPGLVLEEVLAQLQSYTARYLNELCEGFVLELSATKPAAGGGGGAKGGGVREKEEINKVVKVRSPADGSLRQRDVRQLSGGERRRVALALCLGFEELVRRRRRLVCNLMVLDEVLQQLDNTGCEAVARVLRDLPHASVLVVGQTNSSVTANFDVTDVVVKQAGASTVRVAA